MDVDDIDAAIPSRRVSSRAKRVLRAVVAIATVGAVFGFALPRFTSPGAVWHAVAHVGWRGGTLLAVAAIWNLVTYWFVWMAAMPGLGLRRAALVAHAPTAVANTVPGGSYVAVALTFSMLRSWGQGRSAATLAMIVTGVWNNFAKLALPIVALAALAVDGDVDASRVVAALAGVGGLVGAVGAFAFAMRTDAAATRVGRLAAAVATPVMRLLRRPAPRGWDVAVRRFRADAGDLLGARWHFLTAATAVGHVSLFLLLLAALRATGVPAAEVGWSEAFAVFAFARLATAVPFSPGGVGIVELALTAGLVGVGGARAPVVAGVLVYRALTYLLQIPLGAAAYLVWRRTVPSPAERALAPIAGSVSGSPRSTGPRIDA